METNGRKGKTLLSVVIPCYNEEHTLEKCVERVLKIGDEALALEIIIVDDCSKDKSLEIAKKLESRYAEIAVVQQPKNQGKERLSNRFSIRAW